MSLPRPHVSLAVSDIDRSVAFYQNLLGVAPSKRRDDYAKFEPDFGLNLSLVRSAAVREGDGVSHFGIEVDSSEAVLAHRARVIKAGLSVIDEMGTTCCYAKQDKFWSTDPDGRMWEFFVRLDDAPVISADTDEACCAPTCCP